ncbi:uncharacterized protein LOC121809252 [Salvia splendens]|uniref:uncharacterized protein LOC121809252 n=1 Tax=Salvia splendens TaxID=180675 RepID=UPI001C270E94|nr:uncharacterized protein LOC121809252 [Salvia splendens]
MDIVEELQRSPPVLTGGNVQEVVLGPTRRPPLGHRRDGGGPPRPPPRGDPSASGRQWNDPGGVDPITQGFDRIMARFDQLEFILDARDRRVDRLEARRLPEPDLPYFLDYADLDGYRFQRDVWTANEDVPRNFNHGRRDRGGDIRRRRGTIRVTHWPEGRPPRHSTAAAPYRACRDSWHGSSWERPADRYPQGPDRDGHDPLHCLSRGKNMLYVEGTSITPMVDHEHHHSRDNICGYGVVSNDDKVVPDAELSRDAITDAGVFLLLKSSQLRRVPVVLESLSELGTIIINVDRDGCRRGSDDNMLGLMMNDWGWPSQEYEFSIGGSALGGNFHFDAALLEAQGRGSNYAYNTNLKHIRRLEVGLSHKLNMSIGWKVVLGMTLVVHESTRMLYPATLTLDLDDLIYQFAVWMTPHQWEDMKQLWFPHKPELVNKCEINWTRRGHRLTELQYYAGRPNGVGFIGLFCVEVSDFADQLASRQGKEFQKKCLGIYYYIAYAYDIISLCCMLWNGVLIDGQQAQQFPGVGIDNYITLSYFDFDKDKMVYIIILVVVELVHTHVVSGEFYQFVFLQLLPLGIKHKVGTGFLHILQKKTHLEGIGDVVIVGDGSNLDEGLTGDVTVSREFECVVLNIDGTAGREACYMAHVIHAPATKRAELLIELRRNLSRAQQRMTASANRHRRHIEFEVGSFVWLKLQPYRQHSVARPISAKLSKRFYGPFEVEERIGPVAYRLRLPEGSRIHDVFHVSLLRAFVKDDPIVPLPEQFVGNRPVVHPVAILDSKILWHKGAAVEHVLVRWLDGSDSPSWEPLADLMKRFPTLFLEDKEVSKDGGVVTNSTQSRVTEETTIEGKAASPPMQSSSTSESVQELENQSVEDSQVDTVKKLRPTKDIKQPERYHDFVPSSGPAARRNA